jgi:phosphatidylethanolamine-binding protein (PEBP) family uncharacterized protein
MRLESPAFLDGEWIPRIHTGESRDLSPPLNWSGAPQGTGSYVLILEDGSRHGSCWGVTSFSRLGYHGPMPPPGPPHRYRFTLWALDRRLALPAGATAAEVRAAMGPHALAETVLTGIYGRDQSR